jgi:hypothetical protein
MKTCPWCDKQPEKWRNRVERDGDGCWVYFVGCTDKHCPVKPKVRVAGPWGYRRHHDLDSDEIAERLASEYWDARSV